MVQQPSVFRYKDVTERAFALLISAQFEFFGGQNGCNRNIRIASWAPPSNALALGMGVASAESRRTTRGIPPPHPPFPPPPLPPPPPPLVDGPLCGDGAIESGSETLSLHAHIAQYDPVEIYRCPNPKARRQFPPTSSSNRDFARGLTRNEWWDRPKNENPASAELFELDDPNAGWNVGQRRLPTAATPKGRFIAGGARPGVTLFPASA